MVLLDQVNGLNAVRSLRHHIHPAHLGQKIAKLVAGQLFVVDDERGDVHANRTSIVGSEPASVNCEVGRIGVFTGCVNAHCGCQEVSGHDFSRDAERKKDSGFSRWGIHSAETMHPQGLKPNF